MGLTVDRLELAEERISELGDRSTGSMQSEEHRENGIKKNKEPQRNAGYFSKHQHTHTGGIRRRGEKGMIRNIYI